MKDKIFNLDNGKSLYVLEELEYKNQKFVFGTEVDKENEELKDNYIVLEVKITDADKLRLEEVSDFETLSVVNNLFLAKLANNEEE